MVAGKKRYDTFAKHMHKFNKLHRLSYGPDSNPDPLGLPDDGDGVYGRELNYKEWLEFRKSVRINANMNE